MHEKVADLGTEMIVFTGGEPLMRHDLFDMTQRAHDQGMKTALITNGTLIKDVDTLVNQIDLITVSLDSADPLVHNALRGECFERTFENLLLLKNCNIPVYINITLTRYNQHTLMETVHYVIVMEKY